MADLNLTLGALYVHPVKSCAGISVERSALMPTGLEFDRDWMLVDADGEFVSQREFPRMQLVRPALRASDMVLKAPGMLALHVGLDTVEAPCRVRVWNDEMPAYDMGDLAAQWFSDFLGTRVRLARFDPDHRRMADKAWTDGADAEVSFSDGFPLLVLSRSAVDELNARLAATGLPSAAIERFRPNLVLDGLDAHAEDHLRELTLEAPEGPVTLRLVKPCSRCSIPDVDPTTAATGTAIADTLARYRADARVGGALTFGMNAIVTRGIGHTLVVGASGSADIAF